MARDVQKISVRRSIVFSVFLLAFAVGIGYKTVTTILVEGERATNEISQNLSPKRAIPAVRGNILARDGRILACSLPKYKIAIDPCAPSDTLFNNNIDALGVCLAKLYGDNSGKKYTSILRKARNSGRRYVQFSKRLNYRELQQLKTFPILRYGQNRGGLIVQTFDNREWPFGLLARRTVGDLWKENKEGRKGGAHGIEHSYEKALRGEDGEGVSALITGKYIEQVNIPPVNGSSVVTTIDVDVQDVAESSLMRQLEKYDADYGVAILMEVKTGKVRAIANLHKRGNGYIEDYNYSIGQLVEPGSTFKLASVMALLEDDLIDVNDTVDTGNGRHKFYDAVMTDSKEGGHGRISIREAFEVSSNIGISRVVDEKCGRDPQHFVDRLRRLGICDSLGIDIVGEEQTHLKDPTESTWSGITLPWMSIGYEVRITPLQLLTFYNAVANNGVMMRPMFVEELQSHGRTVEVKHPKVLRSSIASRRTIRTVQELLKGVVERGTAQNISGTPYKIAGKTGTAQIANSGSGYKHAGGKKYLASFCGYFPADEPLYSCIVMVSGLREGQNFYGNQVAGSVVRAIADRVYASEVRNARIATKNTVTIAEDATMPWSKGGRYGDLSAISKALKIALVSAEEPSAQQFESTSAGQENIALRPRRFVDGVTPDVRGMGASDAVAILEGLGYRVKIEGYGRVTSQSIGAGTGIIKGTTIRITLG